jgi:hypothetical protein
MIWRYINALTVQGGSMALSAIEQAYLDQTMKHGTNQGSYWGVQLTGGHGNIAGSPKRDGGTGGGKSDGGVKPAEKPDGGSKLVDIGYKYSTHNEDGSIAYHNGRMFVPRNLYFEEVPCDGLLYVREFGSEYMKPQKLPNCPPSEQRSAPAPVVEKAAPVKSYWSFDWHF